MHTKKIEQHYLYHHFHRTVHWDCRPPPMLDRRDGHQHFPGWNTKRIVGPERAAKRWNCYRFEALLRETLVGDDFQTRVVATSCCFHCWDCHVGRHRVFGIRWIGTWLCVIVIVIEKEGFPIESTSKSSGHYHCKWLLSFYSWSAAEQQYNPMPQVATIMAYINSPRRLCCILQVFVWYIGL